MTNLLVTVLTETSKNINNERQQFALFNFSLIFFRG